MIHIKIDTSTPMLTVVRLFENGNPISVREFYHSQTADPYDSACQYAEGLQRAFIVCNRNFTFEGI